MKRLFVSIIILCCFVAATNAFGEEKRFTVVTEPYPPFADPGLDNFGWTWEVTKQALESQGYHAEINFVPWARAVKEVQEGRADGLLNAFWTEDRTQWAVFSTPIGTVQTGFFKLKSRKDISFNGSLESLKGYKIGVGRGYATSNDFDNADFLDKYYFTDSTHCLKMLYKGRLDLVAGIKLVDHYNIDQLSREEEFVGIKGKIVFMEPPLQVQNLHLAISKASSDYKVKVKDFNQGIKQMMRDGTYEKILQKHGMFPE